MFPHQRSIAWVERVQGGLIVATIVGATLAFGGAVWWAKPFLAGALGFLMLAVIARETMLGRFTILKSPLGLLGSSIVLLAAVQILPLPSSLARRVSPRAYEAYALGTMSDLARADDPSADLPEPGVIRTPLSLDRSSTLRWLGGSLACLALFGAVARYADRLGHSLVIWGSIVGSVFVCTILAAAQLLGGAEGLYGAIRPGQAGPWSPSMADALSAPNQTVLRPLGDPAGSDASWGLVHPDSPAAVAGLMGGPDAFLAISALGLPLALGLALQSVAPRGARESFWERVTSSPRGGLFAFCVGLLIASGLLVGIQAGVVLSIPFVLGLLLAGIPGSRVSGLPRIAPLVTLLVLAALGIGVWIGEASGRLSGGSPITARHGWQATRAVWAETLRIARDFPALGVGLGAFGTIHPYYKASDVSPTTAGSSVLQFAVEAGLAGMILTALAAIWVTVRLPSAVRRVGTADRCLAFGLVGTLVCFATFSMIHWTIELAAVALAASAFAGTCHRWLAGGTDLFAERA